MDATSGAAAPAASQPAPAATVSSPSAVEPAALPAASRKRRTLTAAAVGAVALAVIAIAGPFVKQGPATLAPGRPIVAVAVFENESGDPSYERALATLSDVVVERLTALGPTRIGINGNASILRRPRDARDTRAVATETGAAYLIAGLLHNKDGGLSLLVHMIRLDDGTHVWVQRIARPAGDSLEGVDRDVASQLEAAVRRLVLNEQASDSAPSRNRHVQTAVQRVQTAVQRVAAS